MRIEDPIANNDWYEEPILDFFGYRVAKVITTQLNAERPNCCDEQRIDLE